LELRHIADSVNVSSRECLRSFQEFLGISPMQYLIKYRIFTATQLLIDTDYSVTEICARCGFPSPSYFSKMFKRYTGTTPSKYRRQF
jgi:transcriptional regulator GlxA family with amidase domain